MLISTTDDDAIIRYCLPRQTHAGNPALYPQVKMVCQMELTSHLLTAAAFGTMKNLLSPDINDGCNALPGWRDDRPVQPSLGNRTGLPGDKTDDATELLGVVWNGHEDVNDATGGFTGSYPGTDAGYREHGEMVKLPTRRERAFPGVVKERPWKYPKANKKNQSVA